MTDTGAPMLSVRLTSTLEAQLEFLSVKSGLSKNQIVTAAIESYIKQQDLGTIPIKQQIQEASYETFLRSKQLMADECKNAILVANMARSSGIWTAKPNPTGNSEGAIHGRNLVIGYGWSQDNNVVVISKHLPPNPYVGADAYSYNITSYEVWSNYMLECDVVK